MLPIIYIYIYIYIYVYSNVCPITFCLGDIHCRNLHDLTLTFRMGQGQKHIYQSESKANIQLPVLAMVMFVLSVILWEIITFNLRKWYWFEFCTFKKLVKVMSYNVAKYVNGWHFYVQQDSEKMADLSQTMFVSSSNEAYTQTHRPADDSYRRQRNALHLPKKLLTLYKLTYNRPT